MKDRLLVKVIATSIAGSDGARFQSVTSRGIKVLRRGQTILDFVTTFMTERGITHFTLNQRNQETWAASPVMFLAAEPKNVFLFTFIVFKAAELGFYAKDLSREELERDMKELKKVIG